MHQVSSRVQSTIKKAPFRRRKYFLKDTSQPRLLLAAQIILGVVSLIASLALYLLFDRDLTASYFAAHIAISNVRQMLLPVLVGVNVFALLFSSIVLVFYTHRIAGPAYRICRVLKSLARGQLSAPVRLRAGDFLTELADTLNQALIFLNQQIDETQAATEALQDALNRIEAHCDAQLDGWEDARRALGRLQVVTKRFSTGDEKR